MKKSKKTLLTIACAACLVVASVFGTMAYLTDTDAVTNTFTVGNVDLKLDEADVKTDGTLNTNDRVQKNEYHLLPGHTYTKDPTVTVEAGSEKSYVRMIVEVKNIDKLEAALPNSEYYAADGTFLLQNLCVDENSILTWDSTKWEFTTFHESGTYANCYEFRYHTTVDGKNNDGNNAAEKLEPLFTHITVPGEIDNTRLAYLKDVQIVVNAHAIQADGFTNADAAWEAFDGQVNS